MKEIPDFYSLITEDDRIRFLYTHDDWSNKRLLICELIKDLSEVCNEKTFNHLSGKATIERGVTLEGRVFIGKNTIVRNGSYILGPVIIGDHCRLGPNCFIRSNTIIGSNCIVGFGVEVKESLLLDNTKINHFSYIGNSLIGKNADIAAGVVTCVRRLDDENIRVRYLNKSIDTKTKKFGAIIGNNVQIGAGVAIMPGVVIERDSAIYPNMVVRKDIKAGSKLSWSDR